MREHALPFARPSIGEEEIAEVVASLRSGWITTGPRVKRFEEEFAAFVGAPAALAVNSCTAAMHLALKALGIGEGDVVITSPMTFCSTVHVIEHCGARPLLADVEPDTLNLDPARVAERLAEPEHRGRVKAILPVHLYGHPCEMDALLELARAHRLPVVNDAAHALPAKYKGRLMGSGFPAAQVPVLDCFSFYAIKNLTTGEGGMLVGPPELVEEARLWSLHGMSRDAYKRYTSEGSWHYEVLRPGFKYNMTNLQAALGLHQLRRLGKFQARRAEIVRSYDRAFSACEQLETPSVRPEVEHAWHLYVLRLRLERLRISRAQFIEELKARNIGTSVHFIPVHVHPYHREKRGYRPEDFPVAWREYQRLVSLPLYPGMSNQDVDDVIEAVLDVVKKHRS